MTPRRTVCSRGLRFTLQCDNFITHYRWKTFDAKEPETLDWIDEVMQDGDIFFDVGANTGVYTLYAAHRHPQTRIVAFEPEYANLHLLRDNLIHNGVQERVEVYALALSDHRGLSHLQIQDLTPGAALHTESRDPLTYTRSQKPVVWREGVCTYTLDVFCHERSLYPHCIKIDVDGTELEVLQGAPEVLHAPSLRSVLIEPPRDYQAYSRLLKDAGFVAAEGTPGRRQDTNDIWIRTNG